RSNVRGRYSIVQSRRPLTVLSEIHRSLDRRLFWRWVRERNSAALDVRDPASSGYPKQTTHSLHESSFFWGAVTHPHPPLHGQLVTVIRVRRGLDPDLIIRLPDGFFGAISASWTDYATEPDNELPPTPPPLLDPFGLCQIAQFITQIRKRDQTYKTRLCSADNQGYAQEEQLDSSST